MNFTMWDVFWAVSNSPSLALLVKANVALVLGLGAVWALRRSRASVRHAVLAGTFGVLAAIPAIWVTAPAAPIVVRIAQTARPPVVLPVARIAPIVITPERAAQPRMGIAEILLAVWVLGAAVFLAPVGIGLWQVRKLRRTGLPWREMGGVDVLLHEDVAGPMTCGALRPAVVFPADVPEWSVEEVERALVHELEHVRRRDWAARCLARVVCALYWFDPLVWIAWRRLELEAERACDDAVVAGSEPTAYAEQLVAIARRLSAGAQQPALAMASRADLQARVKAVLDDRQQRGRAGWARVAAVAIVAAAVAIGTGPLRLVAAPQAPMGTFRVETSMVVANVTVAYPGGGPVEALGAGDFTVSEDDVPQTVAFFEYHVEGKPSYYLLGYYPRRNLENGQFHRIHIAVKAASTAVVSYRTGYYVPNREQQPPVAGASGPVDRSVRPPALIFKREPEYSEAARIAKYQGVAILAIDVNEDGLPENIKVVRSLGLGLDEKAVEAVRQWRFRPAMKDGKPVQVRTEVQVSFRLL